MTFNHYIWLRMIVETLGALSCALMLILHNNVIGLIITAIVALLWICGEAWVLVTFGRENPRRDELSDKHQCDAMMFALGTLVAVMCAIGFALTLLPIVTHIRYSLSPMLLPTLAIAALALSDARYLTLEHTAAKEADDED